MLLYEGGGGKDRKLDTFVIMGLMVDMPDLLNCVYQVNWLDDDSPKTRQRLVRGYKLQLATTLAHYTFDLVGSYIILGTCHCAYMIQTYPESYGFNRNGQCVWPDRWCHPSEILSNVILEEKISHAVWTVIYILFYGAIYFYALKIAKNYEALRLYN